MSEEDLDEQEVLSEEDNEVEMESDILSDAQDSPLKERKRKVRSGSEDSCNVKGQGKKKKKVSLKKYEELMFNFETLETRNNKLNKMVSSLMEAVRKYEAIIKIKAGQSEVLGGVQNGGDSGAKSINGKDTSGAKRVLQNSTELSASVTAGAASETSRRSNGPTTIADAATGKDLSLPNINIKNRVSSQTFDDNTRTNDGFIHINKTNRNKNENVSEKADSAPVYNKFVKAKPPPISIFNENLKNMSSLIKANLNHNNFTFKIINKNEFKVYLPNSEDHQKVFVALKANKIKSYSFTPKDRKLFSTFVKGLPSDFQPEEIKSAIDELGLNLIVAKIIKLKVNYIIQFHYSSNINELKEIKYLLNCKVDFQSIKRSRLIQCYNCQRYNHTAANCNMTYRCVKCSEQHSPGCCKVPPKEKNTQLVTITDPVTGSTSNRIGIPTFCVNCNKEGHVANANVCEVRIKLVKKLNDARNKTIPNASINISKPRIAEQHTTFASIIKNNNNASSTKCDIFADCTEFFGKSFFEVLSKVQKFAIPYSKIASEKERAMALLQFMLTLTING